MNRCLLGGRWQPLSCPHVTAAQYAIVQCFAHLAEAVAAALQGDKVVHGYSGASWKQAVIPGMAGKMMQ